MPLAEFSNVDELLILLSFAELKTEEKSRIEIIIGSDIDWKLLWKKTKLNDIGPIIFLNLNKLNHLGSIPGWLIKRLNDRYREIEKANALRLKTASEIFRRMNEAEIDVVVLKGALFAESIYGNIAYKKMNDVDILVKFEDIVKIREIYRDSGLVPLALLDESDKNYHLPAFVSRDLTFVAGTHWGLISPRSGIKLDYAEIWGRTVQAVVAGRNVLALAPEDALHHLCLHFHYYKTGLKELGDFANLIRHHSPFDWTKFKNLVESSGSQTQAFRPLLLSEAIFNLKIPAGMLAKFKEKADPFVVSDTELQAGRKDLLVSSRSVYSSQIEKAYLAFTYESRFWEKMKWFKAFWQRLLWPPKEVVYRTNFCLPGEKSLRFLYMKNLDRTGREIGKNFGMGIFFLLMGKSVVDLICCLSGNIFGNPPDKMALLRKELGTDEEKITSLMDSME